MTTRKRWIPTAILLLAAALRLPRLTALGLAHDEVANWLIDRSILAGNHAVYFTAAYGHEAGFHYVQTLFVALLGDNALALRLPAALAGVLGVAVTYALVRAIFGRNHALFAAALLATTFFPIFYSRLALRAISLPVLSGLAALFFWRGLNKGQSPQPIRHSPFTIHNSPFYFFLASLFAGLATYTYMASRVLPIFFGAFVLYLLLFQRDVWRRSWRGIALFAAVYALVALPLVLFLAGTPDAEFRISEINAPLEALRAGNWRPVWDNAWRIVASFGVRGDPLWRQNVAGTPIFDPLTASLFYAGVALALWRRQMRDVFILLWAATAVIPSVVTVDAPSTIRMINILPVVMVFPALVIHSVNRLSTQYPQLSTVFWRISWITCLTISVFSSTRALWLTQRVWPNGGDVPFVWQTALTSAARYVDASDDAQATTIVGWSPDTMDAPTMALALHRDDVALRFAGADTLLLPFGSGETVRVIRPNTPPLPLQPTLQAQLAAWQAATEPLEHITVHTVSAPALPPTGTTFGNALTLLSTSSCPTERPMRCDWRTVWRVERVPDAQQRIFVHAVDAAGNIISQSDGLSAPVQFWQAGDVIVQAHALDLTDAVAALRVGVYAPETGVRLLTQDSAEFALIEPGE